MAGRASGPYDTSPLGDKPGPRRLPDFVRAVAHALIRSGRPKDKAIQLAIGTLENWAAGKGNVKADTRARAAAAIAEWRALNAGRKAKNLSAEPGDVVDLAKPSGSMPSGKYPITNPQQLKAAIQLSGHAKGETKKAVRAHIMRRAKAMGAGHMTPGHWNSDGTTK